MKYLINRGLIKRRGSKSLVHFLGDGEMDEPESIGCDRTGC